VIDNSVLQSEACLNQDIKMQGSSLVKSLENISIHAKNAHDSARMKGHGASLDHVIPSSCNFQKWSLGIRMTQVLRCPDVLVTVY
jgi:hypothetical protein